MTRYFSTKQAAKKLGIRPDALQRAVWIGKLDAPAKAPSGSFLWTAEDIEKASWSLHRRAVVERRDYA